MVENSLVVEGALDVPLDVPLEGAVEGALEVARDSWAATYRVLMYRDDIL